jgi:hypothetical protein
MPLLQCPNSPKLRRFLQEPGEISEISEIVKKQAATDLADIISTVALTAI